MVNRELESTHIHVYNTISLFPSHFVHSEKFEMNEEVDSLLSEKVSNFLLT